MFKGPPASSATHLPRSILSEKHERLWKASRFKQPPQRPTGLQANLLPYENAIMALFGMDASKEEQRSLSFGLQNLSQKLTPHISRSRTCARAERDKCSGRQPQAGQDCQSLLLLRVVNTLRTRFFSALTDNEKDRAYRVGPIAPETRVPCRNVQGTPKRMHMDNISALCTCASMLAAPGQLRAGSCL
jgi:hypothetical protein